LLDSLLQEKFFNGLAILERFRQDLLGEAEDA